MSFSKFGGEMASIALFGRFGGDVAFGLSVPDKNEFKWTMIIGRFSHIVGRDEWTLLEVIFLNGNQFFYKHQGLRSF